MVEWPFALGSALNRLIFPSPPLVGRPLARPPATRRDPVILIGGYASEPESWSAWKASLERDGFRVFVFDVPHRGLADIEVAARRLGALVEEVRRETGAPRIDLIGHSEGGIIARTYAELQGGARRVDAIVTIASPHHGVNLGRLATRLLRTGPVRTVFGTATYQLWQGSDLLRRLASSDLGALRARTTSISIDGFDGLLLPVDTAILEGARNVRLPMPSGGVLALQQANLGHFILHRRSTAVFELARAALLATP